MPELPEVEVSRLGIEPKITGATIAKIILRTPKLRWDIPADVVLAEGQVIRSVTRRAKYIFINTDVGSLILHLGMTGYLRVFDQHTPVVKHDHVDIVLTNGECLRFNDARKFGALLWQGKDEAQHALLNKLGPEPLTDDFHDKVLFERSRGRSATVKQFIMDNHIVVGVGNIYANEALFMSGIHPKRSAGKISLKRYQALTRNIKIVLAAAIEQGGTTLQDFSNVDGSPGYFRIHLNVYGRTGKPCRVCKSPIKSVMLGQRNTFYCASCQR
ncbi:MAG: bifunctional DNA-formamidopyrimidine glycosylase/DNA-(apurinic or apyrimidinic site) lyase [Glaciecola sp.]|jgi:formamidopyrimidine-DNA glycosylase